MMLFCWVPTDYFECLLEMCEVVCHICIIIFELKCKICDSVKVSHSLLNNYLVISCEILAMTERCECCVSEWLGTILQR